MERLDLRKRRLWSESQLFVATLVAPILVYDLALHSSRLSLHFGELVDAGRSGGTAGLILTAMWLSFDIAFALFASILLLVRNQHGRLWFAVAIFLQACAFVLAFVNTVSHVYYVQTLDALDWPLLHYLTERPHELGIALSTEVTSSHVVLVGVIVLLAFVGPWLVRAWALRRRESIYWGPERRSRRAPAIAFALALPALLVGLLPPPIHVKDLAAVRSPLLYLGMTAMGPGRRINSSLNEAVAEARFFEPGTVAIERTSQAPLKNLVVVVLESVRASATTPYHTGLGTTPFLDEIARKSLFAEKAYAVIPSTAKALTAIFCSIHPSMALGPRSLTAGLLGRCLPRLLQEQGYQTMYMQAANPDMENRNAAVPNMGFQTFIRPADMAREGFQEANFLGYEDDTMLEPSARWLKAHRSQPLFAAYLTINAHHDYNQLSRHGVYHFAPGNEELDHYLNNIHADDVFLRALFTQYERLGLLRKTIFVIVGDHGEAFGEHGRRTHNTVPYEEALRVPMMIYDPSGEAVRPGRISTPVSQLDLMPTLLTALGYKLSSGSLHGVSLFEPARNRVLMTSCLGLCATRTSGAEAFVHHFGRRPDELFDLEHDPLERKDLAAFHPELVALRADEVRAFDRRLFSFYYVHTLEAAGKRTVAGNAPALAQGGGGVRR